MNQAGCSGAPLSSCKGKGIWGGGRRLCLLQGGSKWLIKTMEQLRLSRLDSIEELHVPSRMLTGSVACPLPLTPGSPPSFGLALKQSPACESILAAPCGRQKASLFLPRRFFHMQKYLKPDSLLGNMFGEMQKIKTLC